MSFNLKNIKTKKFKAVEGFSLIELMVTLFIVAILMSWAVPSFRGFLIRQSIRLQSNGLIADLIFAKSSAINLSRYIVVQSKNDLDWSDGWWIYIDANHNQKKDDPSDILLRDVGYASDGLEIVSSTNSILFNTVGFSPTGSVNVDVSHPESSKKIKVKVAASGGITSTSTNI